MTALHSTLYIGCIGTTTVGTGPFNFLYTGTTNGLVSQLLTMKLN